MEQATFRSPTPGRQRGTITLLFGACEAATQGVPGHDGASATVRW